MTPIDPESVESAAQAVRGEWWTIPGLVALGGLGWKLIEKGFDALRGARMFKTDVAMKDAEIDAKVSDNQRALIDTLNRLHETERRTWLEDRKNLLDLLANERLIWAEDRRLMREEITQLRARVVALETELHETMHRGDATRDGL